MSEEPTWDDWAKRGQEAVARGEPAVLVRIAEDGATEVYQATGAALVLPSGVWTRVHTGEPLDRLPGQNA